MSTANARKAPPPSSSPAPRTGSSKPPPSKPTTPASTTAKPAAGSGSVRGTPGSPYSARAAVSRKSTNDNASESELESAAVMEDLRSQLVASEAKAESASEEYAAQLKALQARLDEAVNESAKLEETLAGRDEQVEALETDMKEMQRTKKDQEKLYEAERVAMLAEKEEMTEKETELNTIIARLKGALSQKDKVPGTKDNEKTVAEELPITPTSPTNTPQLEKMVQAKDRVIETLQLDLITVQENLKRMETSMKTIKRDAEVQVVELRNANTRLNEDNESLQLLLGKAAIAGDVELFSRSYPDTPSTEVDSLSLGSNLADELKVSEEKEDNNEMKKLEQDVKTLKDQNKALALYINNIIERLLSNNLEGILNKTSDDDMPVATSSTNKELPPTPPEHISISRTRSVNHGRRPPIKPSAPLPTSIAYPEGGRPLQRSMSVQVHSHKRSQSDASFSGSSFANVVVDSMRGSASSTPRQTTFFTGNRFSVGAIPSVRSSANSNSSDSFISEVPSPPHVSTPSAPISGKTLRPLRLVAEATGDKKALKKLEAAAAIKSPGLPSPGEPLDDPIDKEGGKGNRKSWMGAWFKVKEQKAAAAKEDELPSVAEVSKMPDTSRASIDGVVTP